MSNIKTEQQPNGVGLIELNRPQKHHAFDEPMMDSLIMTIENWQQDARVKIIVIKSAGKVFCAGADLSMMIAPNIETSKKIAQLMLSIYSSSKPTLAVVQGPSFGGGVGLIASCHLAIASNTSFFQFSETRLGLIPAVIAPYIIEAIGPRLARGYFLSGRKMSAEAGHQMGLLNEVVSPADLKACEQQWTQLLLQNGPNALQAVNKLVSHLSPFRINRQTSLDMARCITDIRQSTEAQEGINAFLEKRPAAWRQS